MMIEALAEKIVILCDGALNHPYLLDLRESPSATSAEDERVIKEFEAVFQDALNIALEISAEAKARADS